MKNKRLQSLIFSLVLFLALPAHGGGFFFEFRNDPGELKIPPAVAPAAKKAVQPASQAGAAQVSSKEDRSESEKKLSTDLLGLLSPVFLPQDKSLTNLKDEMTALKQMIPQGASAAVKGQTAIAPADMVYVYVYLKPDADIHAVDEFLWKITDADEKNKTVVAYVDVSRLAVLAKQDAVKVIRTVLPPVTNKTNTTEGDAIHRSNLVRALPNGSGAGMKVGVISNGVNTRSAAQATGDLPADGAGLTVLSDTVGGDEGTAMLEIVYDLAPLAQLYFHDCGANTVAFNSAIDALIAAGCNVIVDDISWLEEPFFEQGTVGGHVASVLAAYNIIYASSAGNSGARHHQKTYTASATGGFTTNTLGYPDWHDFNLGDVATGNNLYVHMPNNSSIIVVLEWNDAFGAASNDFDLYVHNYPETADANYLDRSNDRQSSTHNPLEALQYTNNTGSAKDVQISIARYSGTTPAIVEVYVYGSGGAYVYTNNRVAADSIFGHPAVPGALAVGAIAANDLGNVDIEYFDSFVFKLKAVDLTAHNAGGFSVKSI